MAMHAIVKEISELNRRRITLRMRQVKLAQEIADVEAALKKAATALTDGPVEEKDLAER
jgi:hypothetical protein